MKKYVSFLIFFDDITSDFRGPANESVYSFQILLFVFAGAVAVAGGSVLGFTTSLPVATTGAPVTTPIAVSFTAAGWLITGTAWPVTAALLFVLSTFALLTFKVV